FGSAGTKVRVGCELTDLPKHSPFWAVRRYSSRTAGTKVRMGCESAGLPKDSPFR
ncbi:hypothetical protein KI387_013240, partial [Taxus chinensis]